MAASGWYEVDMLDGTGSPLDEIVGELFPEHPSPWEATPAAIAVVVEQVRGAELGAVDREPWRVVSLGSRQRSVDEQIDSQVTLPVAPPPPRQRLIDVDHPLSVAFQPIGAPLPPSSLVTDLNEALFLALVG
jgi:hypothetical protein